MSLEALKWAFDQECGGDATTKFVLITLCNWANEAWEAYPSIRGIAEKTCLNIKTVKRSIGILVAAGVLSDTGERRGQTRQIIVYYVNHEVESFDFEEAQKRTAYRKAPKNGLLNEEDQKRTPSKESENGPVLNGKGSVFTSKEAQKRTMDTQGIHKRGSKKGSAREQEGFEAFWSAYPKKRSKGSAERAWKKLAPGDQLQATILAAIERQRASTDWNRDGGQFIPYPATWLNAQGWENEADGVRPNWTPEQQAFIDILAQELQGLVLAPSEWTAGRACAIESMLAKLGGDLERARRSMQVMARRLDPTRFGVQTFDWWARPDNRDRIRAGHFDREAA